MTDYSDWTREDLIEELNRIQPAPAEQGERLNPLQGCIDELSRMIDRHNTQSLEDGSWKYDYGTVSDAQEALNKLAFRPQPEAKEVSMALVERLCYQGIHTREQIIKMFADFGYTVKE
jgi:hypothetical protein